MNTNFIIRRVAAMLASAVIMTGAMAQSDKDAPFGYATMTSRTDASQTFNLTGGGCYTYPVTGVDESKVITLTAKTVTKDDDIKNAIKKYDVIILDGSEGDFVINTLIRINEQSGKTILGINNARLTTKFYFTKEIKDLLNNVEFIDKEGKTRKGVKNASTNAGDNLGGEVNGSVIKEQSEYLTRKTLFELNGNEDYRYSGVFAFKSCSNIIIRNLKFIGPGSCDVGGADLLGFTFCQNMWVDHCEFVDGIDGNFDITQNTDFCTVSWCTFSYTERAFVHMNTNLVGYNDKDGVGKLNITFAYNNWAKGCNQRMPMVRNGRVHLLNNYYTCEGAAATINPRYGSEVLIEGNFFSEGIKNVYKEKDSASVEWAKDSNRIGRDAKVPFTMGLVKVPYQYSVVKATKVPSMLKKNVGATLFGNKKK